MRRGSSGAVVVAVVLVGAGCGGGRATLTDAGPPPGDASPFACTVTPARDPACDDPALWTRYAACRNASDETTCGDAGGTWGVTDDGGAGRCWCRTNQVSCPCCRSSDCVTDCFDAYAPPDDCASAKYWHCMDQGPLNDWACVRGPNGELQVLWY